MRLLKSFKRSGLLFAAVLFAASVLSGCSAKQNQDNIVIVDKNENNMSYEFAMAEIGDVVRTDKLSCTYKQINEQEVSFAISGKLIDKIYVKEGQTVTKGTLLAELSREELENGIEDLEYAIARNEIVLEHIENNENYDISETWVDYMFYYQSEESKDSRLENTQRNYRYQKEDCNDALEADRQKLAMLQADLKSSRVYAQMDGVIYKLQDHLEGSTSRKDEVIMKILDTSECLFETKAPEYTKLFSPSDIIEMSIASGSAAGQYELRPYHMEEWGETQSFEVIDGPENNGIEVGTYGTMTINVDKKEKVLNVPVEAVHAADDRYFVYVLSEDNMREVRWVETGLHGNTAVEIISGLAEGEKVIRK